MKPETRNLKPETRNLKQLLSCMFLSPGLLVPSRWRLIAGVTTVLVLGVAAGWGGVYFPQPFVFRAGYLFGDFVEAKKPHRIVEVRGKWLQLLKRLQSGEVKWQLQRTLPPKTHWVLITAIVHWVVLCLSLYALSWRARTPETSFWAFAGSVGLARWVYLPGVLASGRWFLGHCITAVGEFMLGKTTIPFRDALTASLWLLAVLFSLTLGILSLLFTCKRSLQVGWWSTVLRCTIAFWLSIYLSTQLMRLLSWIF